jgi:hypothetical protein
VEVMGESKGERCARAAKLSMPAESLPLFTGVRGIGILGSSPPQPRSNTYEHP